MKSARRRAREFAVQALYEWQVAGNAADDIMSELGAAKGFDKIDREYFAELVRGVAREFGMLQSRLAPHLDRSHEAVSPIESAVLLIGAYELLHRLEIPYRVVINEAIELAKTFGGTDGHRYVNGVLDKLAAQARREEIDARRSAVGTGR